MHASLSSTPSRPGRRARGGAALAAWACAVIAACSGLPAAAQDRAFDDILQPEWVTDHVGYFYGPLEDRTPLNRGLNANLGFVVTDAGAVLIDTGPSVRAAADIARAVESATGQPVALVINLGSQDHRWLGNGYFAAQGVEIVALQRTADTQAAQGDGVLERIRAGVGDDELASTTPTPATHTIDADRHDFTFGGVAFSLRYAGDAHFPGDAFLYLPQASVVFSGDIVYTERMLGIHPGTDPVGQLAAFRAIEALAPDHIVPGHGRATDLDGARRDTGDYLATLVERVGAAVADFTPIDEVVAELAELDTFRHLRHYDGWHRRNVHATYLFLEAHAAF